MNDQSNSFGSASKNNQSSSTTPPPENTINNSPTNFSSELPLPNSELPKAYEDKRSIWLWVALGFAGLLIIGLVVGTLIAITNADSIAKNYASSVKNYLLQTSDILDSTASNPNKIAQNLAKIELPKLSKPLLGDLSDEYKKAKTISLKLQDTTDKVFSEVGGYTHLLKFYDDFSKQKNDLAAAEVNIYNALKAQDNKNSAEAVKTMQDSCSKLKTLNQENNLPKTTQSSLTFLSSATNTLCEDVDKIADALAREDQEKLTNTLAKLTSDDSNNLERAYTDLRIQKENIPNDINSLSRNLQSLLSEVKSQFV